MTHELMCLTKTTNGETMNIPNALPTLSAGSHTPGGGKACVMEYVSLLAGEKWSDSPTCTYRPLAYAAQVVNDRLSDDDRHLLVPLIGRLFGSTLPVDDRLFALRVARTVEHLSTKAKVRNDSVERYLAGTADIEELLPMTAAKADDAADAVQALYAANAFYAAKAASYAATASDSVEWLSSVIDIYDELSGRTEHRDVSDSELAALTLAVRQ